MFSLNDSLRYWLWSEPTDMRKSFYTLSRLIRTKMGKDSLDGSVYVFIYARRDRIKLLHMEPGSLVEDEATAKMIAVFHNCWTASASWP